MAWDVCLIYVESCTHACLMSERFGVGREGWVIRAEDAEVRIHTISPNKAVACAGGASSHKSRASDLTTDFVTRSRVAPPELASNAAYMVEATLRGIRLSFLKTKRGSMTTDEVMNAMATPWSDSQCTAKFVPRSKLCTYTQGERDDIVTGSGTIHLRAYSFQMKVFGQVEAVEWVLRMGPQAFFKRVAFSVSPDQNPWDDLIAADASLRLWQGCHDWMLSVWYGRPSYIHCDGMAHTFLRTVLRAISDWLEQGVTEKKEVCRWFAIKIGFAFSDILRNATSLMRQVQFAESLNTHLEFDPARCAIATMELMAATHKWLRELELHAGYYRFMKQNEAVSGDVGARRESSMAEKLEKEAPPIATPPELEGPMKLQRAIIVTAKSFGMPFTISDVRRKLEDRAWTRKFPRLGTQVAEQIEVLFGVGLLASSQASNPHVKRKGPRINMQHYVLASWGAIQGSVVATGLCANLQLTQDAFA